jgi:hypothetical protein
MLCRLRPVQQAAIGNCLPFDPFPFDQNGLAQRLCMAWVSRDLLIKNYRFKG